MSAKEDVNRLTRWMWDNVRLAAGIYRTTTNEIRVDPDLYIDKDGAVGRDQGTED